MFAVFDSSSWWWVVSCQGLVPLVIGCGFFKFQLLLPGRLQWIADEMRAVPHKSEPCAQPGMASTVSLSGELAAIAGLRQKTKI